MTVKKKKPIKKRVATKRQTKKYTSLEMHEEICAIRCAYIEKRLESGSDRFIRMEVLIYGLYATIIGTYVLEKVIV